MIRLSQQECTTPIKAVKSGFPTPFPYQKWPGFFSSTKFQKCGGKLPPPLSLKFLTGYRSTSAPEFPSSVALAHLWSFIQGQVVQIRLSDFSVFLQKESAINILLIVENSKAYYLKVFLTFHTY